MVRNLIIALLIAIAICTAIAHIPNDNSMKCAVIEAQAAIAGASDNERI